MMNNYKLETAVDKAVEEFKSLEREAQTPINVVMLARKYAPVSIKQCLDVLNEHNWALVIDAKPGHLLLDVVIATVTAYIASSIDYKLNKEQEQKLMAEARRQKILNP